MYPANEFWAKVYGLLPKNLKPLGAVSTAQVSLNPPANICLQLLKHGSNHTGTVLHNKSVYQGIFL